MGSWLQLSLHPSRQPTLLPAAVLSSKRIRCWAFRSEVVTQSAQEQKARLASRSDLHQVVSARRQTVDERKWVWASLVQLKLCDCHQTEG